MAKAETKTPNTLTPSWDLVKPSVVLLKKHVETLLWLVVLPAALVLLASQLFSNITKKYSTDLANAKDYGRLSNVYHRIIHEITHTTHGRIALCLIVVGSLWQFIIYPATINFMLRASQGKPADIRSSLRGGFGYFWRTFGITVCTGLAIVGGLILLIIPGFIFARRYALAVFYGMDRQTSVFEAMRLSAADSVKFKGYIWGAIGVYIAFAFISTFAGIVPVLGVVLAFLVNYIYYFGFALRYQTIVAATTGKSASSKK